MYVTGKGFWNAEKLLFQYNIFHDFFSVFSENLINEYCIYITSTHPLPIHPFQCFHPQLPLKFVASSSLIITVANMYMYVSTYNTNN